MRRALRDNGLSIVFGLLFLGSLVGQAIAGHADFNDQQLADGGSTVSFGTFLLSSEFVVDVAENWQSEYLQFLVFVFATVWLIQRGSPESKTPENLGAESDKDQELGRHVHERSPSWARAGGWRTAIFSNSLGLLMLVLFLLSWLAQSLAGLTTYNSDQLAQLQDPERWGTYITTADFWNRTLQNWQSEFLAIGSMVVFSVYLRQRGSPESKPVGAAHVVTDKQG
jgi:hypothetical protein